MDNIMGFKYLIKSSKAAFLLGSRLHLSVFISVHLVAVNGQSRLQVSCAKIQAAMETRRERGQAPP